MLSSSEISSHTARRSVAVGLLMFNGVWRPHVTVTRDIYLRSSRVDLCRCSVDSQLRVRVTDAALSRDLFPADYDLQHGAAGESRPTRWMAPESLVHDHRASSASDMVRSHIPAIKMFHRYRKSVSWHSGRIRHDTRCCFNVRSKADMSRLNLPHGDDK